MNYLELLNNDLILFIISYFDKSRSFINFSQILENNKINWKQLFIIRFPSIDFNEYFVDIDFNIDMDYYYIQKYVHLKNIYKKWKNKLRYHYDYIKSESDAIIKEIYPNVKLENLTEDDLIYINKNILSMERFRNHIPDIRIFSNMLDNDLMDSLLDIFDRVYQIDINFQYKNYFIDFTYFNKSYNYSVDKSFAENFLLYLLYNNVDEYID